MFVQYTIYCNEFIHLNEIYRGISSCIESCVALFRKDQKFSNGKYKDLTDTFCVHIYFFNENPVE